MMEDFIKLDKTNMYEYFRQTKEFIFIDEVVINMGKSAISKKYVSQQEWYFNYHFPNNPIMPGVFQMEAMMQTGGLIINTLPNKKNLSVLFHSAKNINIFSMILPNTDMTTKVQMLSYKRGVGKFTAEVFDDKKLTASMEFSLIVPDEIIKMN